MKSTLRLIESICKKDYAKAKKSLTESLKAIAAEHIRSAADNDKENN